MNKFELLEKLQVSSDIEILEKLPSRYIDLSPLSDDIFLGDGRMIRGCYQIYEVKTNRAHGIIRFGAKNSVNGICHSFIIYNQMFYLNRIATGKTLFIVGRYSARFKSIVVSAVYELSSWFVQSEIKPFYRLPGGIGQSYFMNVIDNILHSSLMQYIGNNVPDEFVKKYRLIPRRQAFKIVHQPDGKKQLQEGLRTFKYEEALAYCMKMEVNKRLRSIYKKGAHLSIDRNKMNALVKKLPFSLTKDQIQCTKEIMDDMDSSNVMFRILQGDVGTGKTAVALLSLFANTIRGGQGVLFAPTTSLAIQHYKNALSFYSGFNVKVGLLISNMKQSQKKKLLEELACGDIDVLISTQAGIEKGVTFKKLTLSIIDEQQQFGVDQRMTMMKKGDYVDTLMMSATPIPRTMSRIVFGDLDISELKEFPKGITRHVDTKVVNSQSQLISKAINRALEIKRQVFVVVPRIDGDEEDESNKLSAKEVYDDYVKEYGEDKVQLLHGRMKKDDQNEVLNKFRNNEKPILISTSIIEVGVDVQEACLMIIYSANYFGLSALHQLRGRVGRNGKNGLTLLVYDGDDDQAIDKLNYLATHTDGFDISQYDLKSRGAGDWAGTDQSGHDGLSVINFDKDRKIFECAMEDAKEILDNANSNEGFNLYKKKIIHDENLEKILV
ncbi:aTP-dependent DNA helicase RecG [Clostridium sp. CAG:568]|nr:aTP-dependent DNA helicase RecG [Clostridium sp. CAG:568]